MESESLQALSQGKAKLIVTSRELSTTRRTISALKRAVPGACIRSTGFRAIFALESEGDPQELAKRVNQECFRLIGHITAVFAEVQSSFDPIKEAAVRIGTEQIGENERFCFRLNKRGAHRLEQDTPKIENEIGGAIWEALVQKYGQEPSISLRNPDIKIIADVLGPVTAVGIWRNAWQPGETPRREAGGPAWE
ncbi:MAG: THUMP domain-containing protein [bacterium]